jgi:serine/threonine protein kinase/rRNA-processing protein FCF1
MPNNEKETIAREFLEKTIAGGFKVFIDTCSLLEPQAPLFWKHSIPLLKQYQTKVIIPLRVLDEIKKHKSTPDTNLAHAAVAAEEQIDRLYKDRLVDIRGEASDKFADNVFLTIFTKFRQEHNMLLITQDRDLALDINRLNEISSVRGKKVMVRRINRYGYLQLLSSPGSQTNQFPKKTFENNDRFNLTKELSSIPNTKINISILPAENDCLSTDKGEVVKLLKRIGDGGEGLIYTTSTDLVAKIYKKDRLTKQKEAKIKLMLSKQIQHEGICYPAAALYNNNKEFAGYLMPRASGKELASSYFLPKQYIEKEFPNWKRKETVKLCLTILKKIKFLHDRNIILGDINPGNILVVSPEEIYFVDTDSYQIEGFPCPVGMTNFTAPEIINKNYSDYLRTLGNEHFAVATLLFMIMLPGKPPYSHQGGGDGKENILSMDFSYPFGEKSNKKAPEGPWRFIWSHLPRKLKEAFYNTFAREGAHNNEDNRLSVDKWIYLFDEYFFLLDSGKLGEWDKMSEEIFPQRFKKDRNREYITCKECGDEIEAGRSKEGMCYSCYGKARHSAIECSDCGKKFYITNGQFDFFNKKDLSLPKRCPSCRDAKRERNISKTDNSPPISTSSGQSSSSSSLCFITTAVCDYFGKPDDCYELTLLREYRDNWLALQLDGMAIIEEYYEIAPEIVRFIACDSGHRGIYEMLYQSYIEPCITHIEKKEYAECKAKYIDMVNFLKELYSGGNNYESECKNV